MISKAESSKIWTDRDEQQWAVAERAIDDAIARQRPPITVGVEASGRVQQRIIDTYTAGGWRVSISHGDQRDPGPFVELR